MAYNVTVYLKDSIIALVIREKFVKSFTAWKREIRSVYFHNERRKVEGGNIPLTIGCCNIVYLRKLVGSGFGQIETNW